MCAVPAPFYAFQVFRKATHRIPLKAPLQSNRCKIAQVSTMRRWSCRRVDLPPLRTDQRSERFYQSSTKEARYSGKVFALSNPGLADSLLQLCKDCQQEVDDVEPNIDDALQEQEILETQTSIGSHVSCLSSGMHMTLTENPHRVSTTTTHSTDRCHLSIRALEDRT